MKKHSFDLTDRSDHSYLPYLGLALVAVLGTFALGHCQLALGTLLPALFSGLALASAPLVLTEEQVKEFQGILGEIKSGWNELQALPSTFQALQADSARLRSDLDGLRRVVASRRPEPVTLRRPGYVSPACAEYLGAAFLLGNARSGRLDLLPEHVRGTLLGRSKEILGIETRAALTTSDIPLPTQYFSELRELVTDFGVARRKMFPFPIGMGTAKPPRFKFRPAFGSIAMSASIAEKSPQIDFASLESHKVGGIVRVPREIDEQSIVPMGQFLARYGAIEFARAEDSWAFMADGTATYENVKGIVKVARDNARTVALASTKTKPSDATLADFRALRTKVNKAALSGQRSAYYLDSTWETQLPTFRTSAEQTVYQRLPDGTALLDGYPIVWTDVLEPYGTTAAADKPIAVFGALDFWWFGEHGQPRLDFSSDVYFASDELATRFIEEIDFDYQQADVTAALLTAAS